MDELNELKAIITSPATGTDKLRDLLHTTEEQLVRYAKARHIIDDAGRDGWSYDIFQESLRVGSGSTESSVTSAEWDMMFPDARLRVRTESLDTLDQGQRMFEQIRDMLQEALAGRDSKPAPAGTTIHDGKKSRWQFWK